MPETLDSLGAKLDEILTLLKNPRPSPVPDENPEEQPRIMVGIALEPGEGVAVRTETAPWFYDGQKVTFRVAANPGHQIDEAQWAIAPMRLLPGAEQEVTLDTKVFGTGERDSEVEARIGKQVFRAKVRWGLINIPVSKAPWYKPPQRQTEQAPTESLADRWKILHDWPSSWPPVADDGKMPTLPEARDVETLRFYARHGYERDGTPMRGPVSLGFAGEAVQDIAEMDDAAYDQSRFKGLARDLACYGVLTKRILIPFDRPEGADLSSEPMVGVAYPSLEALLAREVDMFGPGDNAGPGRG